MGGDILKFENCDFRIRLDADITNYSRETIDKVSAEESFSIFSPKKHQTWRVNGTTMARGTTGRVYEVFYQLQIRRLK